MHRDSSDMNICLLTSSQQIVPGVYFLITLSYQQKNKRNIFTYSNADAKKRKRFSSSQIERDAILSRCLVFDYTVGEIY